MKRFWFFTLSLLFVLAACGQKAPASPFDYNAKVPFDTKTISQTEQSGVTVTQLSYAAHDPSFAVNMGSRTMATLVSPKGDGPFAGIVILYGFAAYSIGSQAYLSEAIALASHGAVTLILKDYFPTASQPTGSQADRPLIIGQVIELRRAFDFLLAQPGVDPKRLGYVGQDADAIYGGVLAGVDKRAKTYVLIAGYPNFANHVFYLNGATIPDLKDLDPTNFIPHAAPASLFFQFTKNDPLLTESLANQYYAAASQPKKIEWYDDQTMITDPVVKARQPWLIEELKLKP